MLVYIHIPKNAGTTMSTILKRNFGNRHTEFYTPRHGNFLSETEFTELIQRIQGQSDALCGHDIVPLEPERSKQLGLKYFTFIRHPVNRAISLYYHEKKVTAGTRHCSQQPFSVYVNERPKENNAITNWQVYNIAGKTDYTRAIRLLEQFIMVGVVERFDSSLLLLREVIGIPDFTIYYTKENVSRERSLSMETIQEETLRTLLEMNQEDLRLFEYASRRLDETLKHVRYSKYKTLIFQGKNVLRKKLFHRSSRWSHCFRRHVSG